MNKEMSHKLKGIKQKQKGGKKANYISCRGKGKDQYEYLLKFPRKTSEKKTRQGKEVNLKKKRREQGKGRVGQKANLTRRWD